MIAMIKVIMIQKEISLEACIPSKARTAPIIPAKIAFRSIVEGFIYKLQPFSRDYV